MTVDVWRTATDEMKLLPGNIRKLIGSSHPWLDGAAKYYSRAEGKHLRPLIVFLMSQATVHCRQAFQSAKPTTKPTSNRSTPADTPTMDHPVGESDVNTLVAEISELLGTTRLHEDALISPPPSPPSPGSPLVPIGQKNYLEEPRPAEVDILPTQRRLAEIVEIIHTASLLHDDVIDNASSRRGLPSANLEFGNKMATLAGDFLLGRACVALAGLHDPEVMDLVSAAIAKLVEGEFMQLKNTQYDDPNPKWSAEALCYYLQKSYLKTASLISASSRAAALLGDADSKTVDAATAYGRNLGMAFQVVDDILDYTRSGTDLGKPAGADLELGLATAPLFFAWKQMPELGVLIGRKFQHEGDARDMVLRSDGIAMAYALAYDYSQKAIAAIRDFPQSEAKDILVQIAQWTVQHCVSFRTAGPTVSQNPTTPNGRKCRTETSLYKELASVPSFVLALPWREAISVMQSNDSTSSDPPAPTAADAAAIIATINGITEAARDFDKTTATWDGGLLGAVSILTKSGNLTKDTNNGAAIAEAADPLTVPEAETVAAAFRELADVLSKAIDTTIAAKPRFEAIIFLGTSAVGKILDGLRSAAVAFNDAVTRKAPAELVATAKAIFAQIDGHFVRGLAVFPLSGNGAPETQGSSGNTE
ncbi:coq1 putative hexaprenyl diphosphate synthase [Purpureocillium lilacinum]|uniref:coq1 putative hexaprenyl diphosphate synthase n=1 Tax=Purpureocillium lilacinum TaxID=33203 RepID=UPI002088E356|nr:coq1 putative hexaprenyl diphosphate synthase [Purpureocillium lilacinum]